MEELDSEHVAQKKPSGAVTTNPTRSASLKPNKFPVKHLGSRDERKKKHIFFSLLFYQTASRLQLTINESAWNPHTARRANAQVTRKHPLTILIQSLF